MASPHLVAPVIAACPPQGVTHHRSAAATPGTAAQFDPPASRNACWCSALQLGEGTRGGLGSRVVGAQGSLLDDQGAFEVLAGADQVSLVAEHRAKVAQADAHV